MQSQILRANVARVINAIPYGRNHAIPREKLVQETGLPDRQVRRCIEEARRSGTLIANRQDGSGYYQTIDLAEIEKQYRQDTARAMSILARRRTERKILAANGWKVD